MLRLFLLALLIIVPRSEERPGKGGELVLLHLIFRHGDVTNEKKNVYPEDPYKNETYYPFGYGQLTNRGKRREFEVGEEVREEYEDFLPKTYSPGVLYAQTTPVDRTKASLELFLAGCFPPTKELTWNKDLPWQPIPYKFYHEDRVLSGAYTGDYKKTYREYVQSEEHQAKLEKHKKTFDYLSEKSGWNVNSLGKAKNLYKCLRTESEWGFKLPEWTEKVFPEKLSKLAVQAIKEGVATDELKRLATGYFLQTIINDTQAKLEGREKWAETKLFLYSAHETNIGQLLTTLGIFDDEIPGYGSYVAFEVRKGAEEPTVKVLYKKPSERKAKALKLPGCEEICKFGEFVEITEKYRPAMD